MSSEADLFIRRQLALEVVKTELDELVAVDHGVPSLIALMRLADLPSFSMAARGGGFQESYAIGGRNGNTCQETPAVVQPMRCHARERFAAAISDRCSHEG